MGLEVQTLILCSNNDIFQWCPSAYYDLLTTDVNHFILLYSSMLALRITSWTFRQHHCQPEKNQLWRLTSQSMPRLDEYHLLWWVNLWVSVPECSNCAFPHYYHLWTTDANHCILLYSSMPGLLITQFVTSTLAAWNKAVRIKPRQYELNNNAMTQKWWMSQLLSLCSWIMIALLYVIDIKHNVHLETSMSPISRPSSSLLYNVHECLHPNYYFTDHGSSDVSYWRLCLYPRRTVRVLREMGWTFGGIMHWCSSDPVSQQWWTPLLHQGVLVRRQPCLPLRCILYLCNSQDYRLSLHGDGDCFQDEVGLEAQQGFCDCPY